MSQIIQMPSRVASDFAGYSYISYLHHHLEQFDKEKIVLDFSQNIWFEANLCAALGAVIDQAGKRFNQVYLSNLRPQLNQIFSKNHFMSAFGGKVLPDTYNTTIKYRRNKLTDEKLIREFLNSELINKPDFPKLSDAAKKEIIRSIFEIYSNAILHGDCEYVFSCGQFYPQKNPPRIDFTIIDIGSTIKRNVKNFLGKEVSGIDSIQWALKDSNTTKPKDKNIPGGLGLKLIWDFAKLNKGKIQIISANGCWQFSNGKEEALIMEFDFPGTLVNLEFNLDDGSFYYLKDEKQEQIIF